MSENIFSVNWILQKNSGKDDPWCQPIVDSSTEIGTRVEVRDCPGVWTVVEHRYMNRCDVRNEETGEVERKIPYCCLRKLL